MQQNYYSNEKLNLEGVGEQFLTSNLDDDIFAKVIWITNLIYTSNLGQQSANLGVQIIGSGDPRI